MPIQIPAGVTFQLQDQSISVDGPKGKITVPVHGSQEIKTENGVLTVISLSDNGEQKSRYGLTRALIQNAVSGVSQGWDKTLELVGVGFRVQGDGNEINLTIGFSHPVKFVAPQGITFTIVGNNKVTVSGVNKELVGEVAARIRAVRPPEPYKGKGIRYTGEKVRRKAGKAVKAVGGGA